MAQAEERMVPQEQQQQTRQQQQQQQQQQHGASQRQPPRPQRPLRRCLDLGSPNPSPAPHNMRELGAGGRGGTATPAALLSTAAVAAAFAASLAGTALPEQHLEDPASPHCHETLLPSPPSLSLTPAKAGGADGASGARVILGGAPFVAPMGAGAAAVEAGVPGLAAESPPDRAASVGGAATAVPGSNGSGGPVPQPARARRSRGPSPSKVAAALAAAALPAPQQQQQQQAQQQQQQEQQQQPPVGVSAATLQRLVASGLEVSSYSPRARDAAGAEPSPFSPVPPAPAPAASRPSSVEAAASERGGGGGGGGSAAADAQETPASRDVEARALAASEGPVGGKCWPGSWRRHTAR
jgi:hypothetical protein